MAKTPIPGIPLTDTIVPSFVEDPHATHDNYYGKGGSREVDTATSPNSIARAINNIPTPRLSVGMIVTASDTLVKYQYTGNVTDTLLINGITLTGWILAVTGGGLTTPQNTALSSVMGISSGILKAVGTNTYSAATSADIVTLIPSITASISSLTTSQVASLIASSTTPADALTTSQITALSSVSSVINGIVKATGPNTFSTATSADIATLGMQPAATALTTSQVQSLINTVPASTLTAAQVSALVNSGIPVPLSTNTVLSNIYNNSTIVVTGSPVLTINTGLILGFGVVIDGLFTYNGTATITDIRASGISSPYCALMNSGTDAYKLVGGKP